MSVEKTPTKFPDTDEARAASLADMDAQIQSILDRTRSIKAETTDMTSANRTLAVENQKLLASVNAVKERDFVSMRNETGLLERAQNAAQRDINISELQLKKLRRACATTDMEFNALLVAINHFSTANDKFEDEVQAERSMLTPAAMQAAFEMMQQSISEKLAQIQPEYVHEMAFF